MTSYFEISGLIIESDSPSNPSFQSTVSVIERPERGRKSIRSQGASPQMSSEGRGSLARHWIRSITYPTERLLEEPGVLISPKGLGTFGIKTYLDLMGKHYDYFIKGEDPWTNYQD